jgi:hypothetical protein
MLVIYFHRIDYSKQLPMTMDEYAVKVMLKDPLDRQKNKDSNKVYSFHSTYKQVLVVLMMFVVVVVVRMHVTIQQSDVDLSM